MLITNGSLTIEQYGTIDNGSARQTANRSITRRRHIIISKYSREINANCYIQGTGGRDLGQGGNDDPSQPPRSSLSQEYKRVNSTLKYLQLGLFCNHIVLILICVFLAIRIPKAAGNNLRRVQNLRSGEKPPISRI
ncbi:hypothetical protein BJX61DRAFT_108399 [Aspergillus egyptiacus]|nr:hypothetical protein BJX61DRAFT_108399 [Aspergillus egyptiacus]